MVVSFFILTFVKSNIKQYNVMKSNVSMAINEAEKKYKLGLLVNGSSFNDEDEKSEYLTRANNSESTGDIETIYSIAALYSSENIGGDGSEDEILDELISRYPSLI